MGSVEVGRQPHQPSCFGCRAEDDKENHQQAWHGLQKQVAASLGQVETASSPIGLSAAQLEELTSAGHLDSLDPKQQICFDFTKGLCTRGEACKYSHDIALIVKVNSQERGICFDFLRGQCSRGLLCRFSHDLSNITSQSSQAGKTTRRNAPICYDFVKGLCSRGTDCRYSHDINSIINGTRGSINGSHEICYDFTRGRCSRGTACRYSHDLRLLAANGTLSPLLALPAQTGHPSLNALHPLPSPTYLPSPFAGQANGFPAVQRQPSPYLTPGGLGAAGASSHGRGNYGDADALAKAAYLASAGMRSPWPVAHGMTPHQLAAAEGLLAAARMPQPAVPNTQPYHSQHRASPDDTQMQYARMIADLSNMKLEQNYQHWPAGMQGYPHVPATHPHLQLHGHAGLQMEPTFAQMPVSQPAGHAGLMEQVSQIQRALAQKSQMSSNAQEAPFPDGEAIRALHSAAQKIPRTLEATPLQMSFREPRPDLGIFSCAKRSGSADKLCSQPCLRAVYPKSSKASCQPLAAWAKLFACANWHSTCFFHRPAICPEQVLEPASPLFIFSLAFQ
ncbi:hypothetical protein WJX84_006440 [Apatococcus fuscideae]|uniref:C3H1-type domain-containing protein n=1 Tax=Apatococcus fuscideae TaxID=2026836 RepID=A0AAW1THA9_9CHLO